MLANRRLIKMVFTILVLAVAYDVWHLTSKSRSAASAAVPATRPATASLVTPPGSTREVPLTGLVREVIDRIERHRRCEPLTPPERNPFLFQREQDSGLPLAVILDQERRQRELEERQARETVAESPTAALDLSAYRLTAVLVRPSGSLAIINGNILGVGETLPGTSIRVAAISAEGVTLSQDSLQAATQDAVLGFASGTSK